MFQQGFSFVFMALMVVTASQAAVPTLEYLFPAGGQRGTGVIVTTGGKFESWPVKVWTDCAGLNFYAETNQGAFTVKISTDAPVGAHLVRVFSEEGASEPRPFVIGNQAEQLETEPNDNAKHAQLLEKLPVTINGRLEKSGDVDSFSVRLKAGRWLVATVDAYSLGSPMDPMLYLLDSQGVRIAFGNDSQNLDPLLVHQVERSGLYVLQLAAFVYPPQADVRFTGSKNSIYRLTITDGPFARYAFPGGVERGHKVLQLFGWNLSSNQNSIEYELDTAGLETNAEYAVVSGPVIENRLRVPIVANAEQREIEPNNKLEQAQKITVPCTLNGRIDPGGDEDQFEFIAQKDERLIFQVQSASLGFPLDALLEVKDATGKHLAENDDHDGSQDPLLLWAAPADGSYFLSISDRTRSGGIDFVYRLQVSHQRPDFKATIDNHACRVEPGKTAEMKVNVSRLNEYRGKLVVTAHGLPEGVSLQEVDVPEKGGEVQITLAAGSDAKPANQPFQVLVAESGPNPLRVRAACFDLKGKEAKGDLLINQTDQIWLTVLSKAER